MCATFTTHWVCGCAEPGRRRNGCAGNCSGNNIRYDDTLDVFHDTRCPEHQYLSPPTSSDESASDTSAESSSTGAEETGGAEAAGGEKETGGSEQATAETAAKT